MSAAGSLLVVLIVGQFVGMQSFLASPTATNRRPMEKQQMNIWIQTSFHGPTKSALCMTAAPDFDSNDPFAILGLDPSPNLDKKVIKRAYKKLALKYHPDVAEDSDKKRASSRFAKVNWAYATLTGKNQDAAWSRTSSTASSSSSSSGWTPPHRRKASTASTSSGGSSSSYGYTDWRDYIPNYPVDEEDYGADGDSFGAIFSDLFKGAAMGGGTVFRDFVEFLENNVEGYSGGAEDDAQLRILLQTGTVDEIGDEMDETEMVVKQLSSKLKSLEDELIMVQADLKRSVRYLEKIDLEERVAELQARKDVVNGYIKKARKRLISLQTRYKQLITDGDNDRRAGGGSASRFSWDEPTRGSYASTGYGSSASSSTRSSHTSPGSTSSTSSSRTGGSSSKEDAWKDESFGSFGRGRGSSRRRSRQRTTRTSGSTAASGSSTRSTSGSAYTSDSSSYRATSDSSRRTTYDSGRPSTSPSSTGQTQPASSQIPPHRRSSFAQEQDDKRRLRELKVDDEFEKLKKDLGL